MAKYCLFAVLLAAQSLSSSGAFVHHKVSSRGETNLRVQSEATSLTFSQAIWNNTMGLMQKEIDMVQEKPVKVNKVYYVIFAMIFGCCGCDRCFMGQICLGTVKGCTMGGLLVWHVIDYFVCLACALTKEEKLNMMGYNAQFEKSSIDTAFYLAAILFGFQLFQQCMQAKNVKAQMALQQQQQEQMLAALNQMNQPPPADIPRRHQSLAYMPTLVTRNLRKAGVVTEKPTIPELIAAFDTMDTNKDGQLDHEEIKTAMSAMGVSDETVDEMIKDADKDGDGKISKDEFLVNMTQKQKDEESEK